MPSLPKDLIVAGIMTGNSLDAFDIASFRSTVDQGRVQQFEQIGFFSIPCSEQLKTQILALKAALGASGGKVVESMQETLNQTYELYHHDINTALSAGRAALRAEKGLEIDLCGMHGQTLGHCPPSIAAPGQRSYTIQLGNGGAIADYQKVVTVADFRSDDLLNGGEGAPLAPAFNALLMPMLKVETAAFINAGNTSNIAVIKNSSLDVRGWDCGPCNQFPDFLMRTEKGAAVDEYGTIAQQGVVQPQFIERLWNESVVAHDGRNALEVAPPRSFDPQWYHLPKDFTDAAEPFENRLRSVVAFSAYCVAHSIALAIQAGYVPEVILLFGGGWNNAILLKELKDLCAGRAQYVLPTHHDLFSILHKQFTKSDGRIKISDELGLPSRGMEAGIFAFAAVQRILNQPFTRPSFTNCKSPTRCGAVFLPKSGEISSSLKSLGLTDDRGLFKDVRLSRASLANQEPVTTT